MSKEEINKHLTEAMGECWHEWHKENLNRFRCKHCQSMSFGQKSSVLRHGPSPFEAPPSNDFYTWTGFGKLWEWAQKQEWWRNFIIVIGANVVGDRVVQAVSIYLIRPERFATAVYKYLKDKQ